MRVYEHACHLSNYFQESILEGYADPKLSRGFVELSRIQPLSCLDGAV